MPQHPGDGGGALRQPGRIHRMIEQQPARLPLLKAGAAIGAGDQPHIDAVCLRILLGKALRQIDSGKGAVGVDGTEHRLPAAVTQNLDVRRADGLGFIEQSTSGHIGLPDHQKRMDHWFSPLLHNTFRFLLL